MLGSISLLVVWVARPTPRMISSASVRRSHRYQGNGIREKFPYFETFSTRLLSPHVQAAETECEFLVRCVPFPVRKMGADGRQNSKWERCLIRNPTLATNLLHKPFCKTPVTLA